jgi:uncharacterized protein YkwD
MKLTRKRVIILSVAAVIFLISNAFAFMVGYTVAFNKESNIDPEASSSVAPEQVTSATLYEYTNKERINAGVPVLNYNPRLEESALSKCQDMANRDYWSHVAPDGTEPWVFIQSQKITYTEAGENQAYGYTKSADVVGGWMTSPGHKANLLSTKYDDVGFGVCTSDNFQGHGKQTIVVQHFIKR